MKIFEEKIIDKILKCIEDNQVYLTQEENLPQLSKLGFIFETLFYSGRLCYGYDGIIKEDGSCENNPKYELGDNIKYESEEIEDLVYDAWGMHVSDDIIINYQDFCHLILHGKEITELEIKSNKKNKTFDEWCDLMLDEKYPYRSLFKDKRDIANYLLLVIGNGFEYDKKLGIVYESASGAKLDINRYGDWKNAKFSDKILEDVKEIIEYPETKLVLDKSFKYLKERERKRFIEENSFYLEKVNKYLVLNGKEEITIDDPMFIEIITIFKEERRKKYSSEIKFNYYPISENYSIITEFDENTEKSYMKVGIEVCLDILSNKDMDTYEKNKIFAENFLKKYNNEKENL